MICTVCCKSFEGFGVVCSDCASSVSSRAAELPVEKLDEDIVPGNKDRRFSAFIIDGAVIQLLCFVPQLLAFYVIARLMGSNEFLNHLLQGTSVDRIPVAVGVTTLIASLVIWVFVRVVWMVLFECSSWLGSPGKLLVGLKVVHQSGRPLTYREATLRNLAFALPWIIGVLAMLLYLGGTVAGLGILLVPALALQGWIIVTTVTKGSNGWHDDRVKAVVAGTGEIETWRIVVAYTLVALIASCTGIIKAVEQKNVAPAQASSPVTYSDREV